MFLKYFFKRKNLDRRKFLYDLLLRNSSAIKSDIQDLMTKRDFSENLYDFIINYEPTRIPITSINFRGQLTNNTDNNRQLRGLYKDFEILDKCINLQKRKIDRTIFWTEKKQFAMTDEYLSITNYYNIINDKYKRLKNTIKFPESIKRVYSELDPYGEEIWED